MPKTLKDIRLEWQDCTKCKLSTTRNNVVIGEGSGNANILIIGEAPGEYEDMTGVPFIGESGDILTLFLNNAGLLKAPLTKEQTENLKEGSLRADIIRRARVNIYITNLVACRPPENRDPARDEIEACWPRVAAQIYAVDPLLIIAVGRPAASYLLGRNVAITTARGKLVDIKFPGMGGDYTVPVLPILHPAYLLRNADKGRGGVWEKTHQDLELARQTVELALASHRGENVL
jgi:DNA polymerase